MKITQRHYYDSGHRGHIPAEMMEQGSEECVKEQLLPEMNIKIEVEEEVPCTAHIDIEIDVTHVKQEPELLQSVETKLVLLVKEEILEDSSQGTDEHQGVSDSSPCAIVGSTSVAADSIEQGHIKEELVHIKEELEDTDLDIGPTVLQHMDSHYRTSQLKMPKTSTERVREYRARQRERQQQEGQRRQRGGNRRGAGRPRGTRTAADRNREYRQRAKENRERLSYLN